uniref:Uncharacterized protein n=1 Tax=Pipistrellus kuhlii TaxID=59472 RepID=A0A7J7UG98_PIPKU|nr:hypothetical protein mPipKuh1_009101 [Pipistrellus kuhlii]
MDHQPLPATSSHHPRHFPGPPLSALGPGGSPGRASWGSAAVGAGGPQNASTGLLALGTRHQASSHSPAPWPPSVEASAKQLTALPRLASLCLQQPCPPCKPGPPTGHPSPPGLTSAWSPRPALPPPSSQQL